MPERWVARLCVVIKIDEWKNNHSSRLLVVEGGEKQKIFEMREENLRIIEENKPLSPLWLRILNEYEACLKHK